MRLRLRDMVTDPGAPERANEDAAGVTPRGAVVIDGATGLADAPIMTPAHGPTDAAWLATFMLDRIRSGLDDAPDLRELIRSASLAARDAFDAAGGTDAPTYARPSAAFQLLRLLDDGVVETAGLADCRLVLQGADGALIEASGPQLNRKREQAAAQAALARNGGFGDGSSLRDPETLAALRASRARHNTPGGYWTLGLAPEAADYMAVSTHAVALPARGLLMSDGFADLIDLYEAYTPAALIDAAFATGLAPLLEQLRRLEREVDPDGAHYPRFKRSDDSTALAFEVGRLGGVDGFDTCQKPRLSVTLWRGFVEMISLRESVFLVLYQVWRRPTLPWLKPKYHRRGGP